MAKDGGKKSKRQHKPRNVTLILAAQKRKEANRLQNRSEALCNAASRASDRATAWETAEAKRAALRVPLRAARLRAIRVAARKGKIIDSLPVTYVNRRGVASRVA